jgi:hypothetical protein
MSEKPSLVGLHTYYDLPGGTGRVTSRVQPLYNDGGQFKPMPKEWNYQGDQLTYDLTAAADYGFVYSPDPQQGMVALTTSHYRLTLLSTSPTPEHAWQLYHPDKAEYVCVEPLSARNPRGLTATQSRIEVLIAIEPLL